MSTVTLAVAGNVLGNAILPGIGGVIGQVALGAVGAMVDSTFLFPAIFKNNTRIEGPRVNDLRIQSVNEGAGLNLISGLSRVAGSITWHGGLKEVRTDSKQGGKGGSSGATSTTYTYFASLAIDLCDGPVTAVKKVWANGKLIWDDGQVLGSKVKSMSIFFGGYAQPKSSVIVAVEGDADTPAYRGRCYIVLEDLELTDFGNSLPQVTALVERAATTSEEVIETLFTYYGWRPDFIDASDCTDGIVGYAISGAQVMAKALEPIILHSNMLVRERNGVLYFELKGTGVNATIDDKALGVAEWSEESRVDGFKITTSAIWEMPNRLVVTYIDPDRDFEDRTQAARRAGSNNRVESNIRLPVVTTAELAASLAERELRSTWEARKQFETTLGPTALVLEIGDTITVDNNRVRVTELSVGRNFVVELKGVYEDVDALVVEGAFDFVTPTAEPIYVPSETNIIVMNLPPLLDDHVYQAGVYVATYVSSAWNGGAYFTSRDDVTYARASTDAPLSTVGYAEDVLATATSYGTSGTVTIRLWSGSIESASASEVEAGANWALLGDEVIAFETVTDNLDGSFTLTNVWRGLRDTLGVSHSIGEHFVLLTTGVRFIPLSASNIGLTHYAKSVPLQGREADHPGTSYTFAGKTLKPFKPRGLSATVLSNDITATWNDASRFPVEVDRENLVNGPNDESLSLFTIEFRELDDTLRRMVVSHTSTSITYTAAQQTSDGRGSPGASMKVNVRKQGAFQHGDYATTTSP